MEISSGWNSEFARKKYGVALDEGDLRRILIGADIPVSQHEFVSLEDAHTLLHCTSEILSRRTYAVYLMDGRKLPELTGDTAKDVKRLGQEARALTERRDAVLGRLKSGTFGD
jgi:hypothetical protein